MPSVIPIPKSLSLFSFEGAPLWWWVFGPHQCHSLALNNYLSNESMVGFGECYYELD